MVTKGALVLNKLEVSESDSHFWLTEVLTHHLDEVYIVDVSRARLKWRKYSPLFSSASFLNYFADFEEIPPVQGVPYLVRLNPPLWPYDAAAICGSMGSSVGINSPQGVMAAQSKALLPHLFQEFGPYKIVSTNEDLVQAAQAWGEFVLKPLSGFGGTGVRRVRLEQLPELAASWKSSDDSGTRSPALAMPFFSEIGAGERRTFVLNGKAVGCLLKRPAEGGWLTNAAQGGSLVPIPMEALDEDIAGVVSSRLLEFGISFFAVDTIVVAGTPRIIEINVSNPGGVALVDRTFGGDIARGIARAFVAKNP